MNDYVIESSFRHKGYQCVVVLSILGHRCGYVGIPESHPYYGEHYDKVPVDCHGGLKYSRGYLLDFGIAGMWWFGFDTAHFDDKTDNVAVKKAFKDHPDLELFLRIRDNQSWGTVKKLRYVEHECRKIADQLVKLDIIDNNNLFYKLGVMCGDLLYTTYEFDSFNKLFQEAKSINNKFKSDMANCDFVIQTFIDNSYDFKKSCFSQIRVNVNSIEDRLGYILNEIVKSYSEKTID